MLETDPDLARWAWCSGVYQQYHSMLFPVTQVYAEPNVPQWERIMAAAHHVFGPSAAPAPIRAGGILVAVKDNMSSFLRSLEKPSLSPTGQTDGGALQPGSDNHHGGAASPYRPTVEEEDVYQVFDDMGDVGLDEYQIAPGFDGTQLGDEVWFQWPPPMNS
jgi:hypothetical protein